MGRITEITDSCSRPIIQSIQWRLVRAVAVVLLFALIEMRGTAAAAPFGYITNAGAGNVSVVDTGTNTVSASAIPVGSLPQQVAVKPDGKLAYVTNAGSNTVSVIDTATNSVLVTIPVGLAPSGLAVATDGSRVYVANSGSDTVSVIATATNTVLGGPIPVGGAPTGVAITSSGIPSIPTLSDGAFWLLAVAMGGALALRIVGGPPVSCRRRPPRIR